jgi:Na+/H+-dicarboxylate symporter
MRWYRKLHWRIIAGLLLGLAYGGVAAMNGWERFTADWIAPFGTIFINSLQLIAVPLVLSSLVTGVASLSDLRKLSRIGGKTIAIYIGTTAIAVMIGLIVVNSLRPGESLPEETRIQLQQAYSEGAAAGETAAGRARERGPLQFLVDLVPDNFFASASNNRNMLQLVFVALFVGAALIQLPSEQAQPLLALFRSVSAVVLFLVDVIMWIAPLGVFALIANTITSLAGEGQVVDLLGALGLYCFAVVAGLFLHMTLTYGAMVTLFTPMKLKTFFTGISPAQLVAFSSSSSGATLPVTMERCEDALGVSEEVSSFVLPLGATMNMDGTGLYQAVAAVFIAQALDINLGLGGQLTIVLTAVLASIGTAAVPGAGVIMLVIILEAIGVPTAGIALILGVDRILDMLRTATNITGDAAVATVVAASEGQLGAPANDAG